jgi:hypothetical protein
MRTISLLAASITAAAQDDAVEHFLDVAKLATSTGHPVRATYRTFDGETLPRADATIVAPATYNTINK